MKSMNPLDLPMLVIPPSHKKEMSNFRGIVPIQSLISIKLSLKQALVEVSMTKLMYLIQWDDPLFSCSFTTQKRLLFKNRM